MALTAGGDPIDVHGLSTLVTMVMYFSSLYVLLADVTTWTLTNDCVPLLRRLRPHFSFRGGFIFWKVRWLKCLLAAFPLVRGVGGGWACWQPNSALSCGYAGIVDATVHFFRKFRRAKRKPGKRLLRRGS
jgi:hypothetical protein